MDDTVHSLSTFDHEYIINYPTVMFSTGYVTPSLTN